MYMIAEWGARTKPVNAVSAVPQMRIVRGTPTSEMLKSTKMCSFSWWKYVESVANFCTVFTIVLSRVWFFFFFFLLKKMLSSALGSMTENSNNASVFFSVSVLTFWLQLCKWHPRMEVQCVSLGDVCVYSWLLGGQSPEHLSKNLLKTLSPPTFWSSIPRGLILGKLLLPSPPWKPNTTQAWEPLV